MTRTYTQEEMEAMVDDVISYACMSAYASSGFERDVHRKSLREAKAELLEAIADQQEIIAAIAQPVSEPDGWKLVPIEPTEKMLEAGKGAHYQAQNECRALVEQSNETLEPADSRSMLWRKNRVVSVYEAMLSAAPKR